MSEAHWRSFLVLARAIPLARQGRLSPASTRASQMNCATLKWLPQAKLKHDHEHIFYFPTKKLLEILVSVIW